jgi:hypothetical protein
MADGPITEHEASLDPLNLAAQARKYISKQRAEDETTTISMVSDVPSEMVEKAISDGDPSIVRGVKADVEKNTAAGPAQIANAGFEAGKSTEETALLLDDEADKQRQFFSTQDNLYMEQAIALGDPLIDAGVTRFATNLQIGQEKFEAAIAEVMEDSGFTGYATDFIDRYFVRAVPVGGYEQINNRNEEKGTELLTAALTMDATQYEQFIEGYVADLRNEGFFKSDNIFALADGLAEFGNAGYDDHELMNRTFGVIDVVAAPLAALKAVQLIKATTPLRRLAALKGPKAAGDAAERLVQGPTPAPRTVNDLKPEVMDPGAPGPVKVPAHRGVRVTQENHIVDEITDATSKGVLGRDVNAPEVQRAYTEAIDTLRKTTNNPIVNVRHPLRSDVTGNIRMNLTFGTPRTGSPYKTERGAENMARKVRENYPTAKAVQVDPADAGKGYYVELEEILDPAAYVDELPTKSMMNAVGTALARFTGSKNATENTLLNDLALMAEGAVGLLNNGRAIKKSMKVLNGLNSDSQNTISKVFKQLRDGKDSFIREHYTDGDFAIKYAENHPTGAKPTQKEIDAFNEVLSINDASFMMKAHNRMQKYIRQGFYGLTLPDGTRLAGKVTDEALGTENIVDVSQGTIMMKKDLHRNTKVWKLDRPLEGGGEYIVNPAKVNALTHTDVMGYNAGGRRINPNANYFVTVGEAMPRAFLTTVTDAQAVRAVEQLKNIQRAIREAGEGIVDSRAVDDVIRANNEWNPEIQDLESFSLFAKEKKLDMTKEINFKTRDGEIRTGEVDDLFSETWDEYVTHSLHRADDSLTDFGGGEAMNYDPVQAMFRDFGSAAQHFAHNVYTNTALEAWLKAARRKGSGWDVAPGGDSRRAFEEAKSSELHNKRGKELSRQHSIIKNRLGIKSHVFQRMEAYGSDVQEFVMDVTGKNVLARNPLGNVANKVLAVGFQGAFGLLNTGQFFVQGFHMATIAGITADLKLAPGAGMRAIGMAPATRLILLGAKTADEEALMVERLAAFAGHTVDEMKETIDYIRVSGRNELQGSLVEEGTGAQWNLSGWKGESFLPSKLQDAQRALGKGKDAVLKGGLVPFTEGERFSRLTAINAAIIEYRAANPGAKLSTAHAKKWISRREQALSFRMSNANRATMQEGFGKMPTQWFGYTMRAMEAVIIGRDFTKAERAKAALVLMPMFGMTGMGAASVTDALAEKIGVEPAGNAYTLINRGIADAMVDWATGGEIELALADRLAPITLLADVWAGIQGEKAPWEVALGPSGDIGGNMIKAVIHAAGELVNGHSVSATEDAVRAARQFSGVNNIFQAYGMYQNGVYRSRTGATLPFEMDTGDAIGQFLGFTPREVSDWYKEKKWSYRDSREVKDYSKGIEADFSRAVEMWHNGDTERALKYMQEMELKISFSGFSMYDQIQIRRAMRDKANREVPKMIMEHYRRENPYRAEVVENQLGGK